MSAPFTEHITFLPVADLARSRAFYGDTLGLELVVDQGDCLIYRVVATAFLGICVRSIDTGMRGVITTLVTPDVDGWHNRLMAAGVTCDSPPSTNAAYGIYQAFYRDPDGHVIEIQRFADPNWASKSD